MNDHYSSHGQSNNVHHIRGALKYNSIGDLDIPRVTIWYDSPCARHGIGRPDEGTQGDRSLSAYCVEVSKAHGAQLWNTSV